MKQILAIFLAFLLASCGDDAIVHRSGESTTMKLVALTSENRIFVQGEEGSMTKVEFDDYLSRLTSRDEAFSFVIQSSLGSDDDVTKSIVELIKAHGIPKSHIAVAKSDA